MSLIPRLTDSGRAILLNGLAGGTITFSKIAIGSGAEPDDVNTLTELVAPQVEMAIESREKDDSVVTLIGSFDNGDISEGFKWTETGVYARDEDGNEVLYAYVNSGENYDYVPAGASGKTLTTQLSIAVAVDDMEEGSIIIETENGLYVTEDTFNEAVEELEKEISGKADSDHTHNTGTATAAGFAKLYSATGSNTDGAMTQKAATEELKNKSDVGHKHTIDDIVTDVTLTCVYNSTVGAQNYTWNQTAYTTDTLLTYDQWYAYFKSIADENGDFSLATGLSSITFNLTEIHKRTVSNSDDYYFGDSGGNGLFLTIYNNNVISVIAIFLAKDTEGTSTIDGRAGDVLDDDLGYSYVIQISTGLTGDYLSTTETEEQSVEGAVSFESGIKVQHIQNLDGGDELRLNAPYLSLESEYSVVIDAPGVTGDGVDTTSGGTEGSQKIITSGAVKAGLEAVKDSVVEAAQGTGSVSKAQAYFDANSELKFVAFYD